MESGTELLPNEAMTGGLHSTIALPPSTSFILQLMCGKKDLLILSTPHEVKLFHHGLQPMVGLKQILCPGEDGWLGAKKVREVILSGSTSFAPTTKSDVLSNDSKELRLLLLVALNLHEHIRHCWRWWRLLQVLSPSIGTLRNVLSGTSTSPHPPAIQGSATRRQVRKRYYPGNIKTKMKH